MAIIEVEHSQFNQAGTINCHGIYKAPVIEIDKIQSLADYNRNKSNRFYCVYGEGDNRQFELMRDTTFLSDIVVTREVETLMKTKPLGTSETISTDILDYQGHTLTRKVTGSHLNQVDSPIGRMEYISSESTLGPAFVTESMVYGAGYYLDYDALRYTDVKNGYLSWVENDIRYFIRCEVSVSITYTSSEFSDFRNRFEIDLSSPTLVRCPILFGSFTKPIAQGELPDNLIFNDVPTSPFDPIPPSGPDTPGGQFDDQSDIIGDSSLPTLSASDTGFTRIYIPTLSQVKALARYLWTDDTVIETIWNKIKQFFENPMEAIIGFNLVPVPVPSSGTKSFALMYIDTGVDMDTAANQFVDVDCGTLPIQLFYGSALDYSPYTKISCYLPYIGMVQLNTDEVVGRTLQVKYRIDIVSGSCVAKIFVDGNCIYQYSGHCAITIPMAASDFSSYVSAAISVAKLAVGAATGGASGAAAAALNADINQQTGSMFSVQGGSDNSGQIQLFAQGGASGPSTQTEQEVRNTQASFSGITPQNLANTVGEIMTAKPHVQHSGSFSGNSGYLGVRRPFVIIERPNLCLPENYQGLNGFPAMITMLLGECSGYTKVQQMVLSGCTATNPEQAEIMSLLKGGVIF